MGTNRRAFSHILQIQICLVHQEPLSVNRSGGDPADPLTVAIHYRIAVVVRYADAPVVEAERYHHTPAPCHRCITPDES